MTVKTRITLFIVGAGFVSSLLFSGIVFYELVEQPIDLLDMELAQEVNRAIKILEMNQKRPESTVLNSSSLGTFSYWLEIYEPTTETVLYQSGLAKQIKLPRVEAGSSAFADAAVHGGKINIGQADGRDVPFRIRTFEPVVGGRKLRVQAAIPIVKLKHEIQELIWGLVAGLIFSSLALIFISYFVAGKILGPIATIKDLAQNISEKNLDNRIPVGEQNDELNGLARTINRMLDRLQHSFIRQREFLFDTSHELKTPLTTMRLAVDEICASDGEELSSLLRHKLLRLNKQVLRMERLVKDLLNLSSLESVPGLDRQRVELTALLSSLVEEYRFLADAYNINMDVHLPKQLFIQGDEEKLHRAFSNILDNAIKYNVEGGRIELTGEQSAGWQVVSVGNMGPGVPEAEIPYVFDQFYRLEKSRSIEHGGSGLGLAIVKKIIELHGGSVKFESERECWTKVTVSLPRYLQ
jgi:signal transduction histidine kinase